MILALGARGLEFNSRNVDQQGQFSECSSTRTGLHGSTFDKGTITIQLSTRQIKFVILLNALFFYRCQNPIKKYYIVLPKNTLSQIETML